MTVSEVLDKPLRLTGLSHGGGCGCKIAPSVLQDILSKMPATFNDPALLIGNETGDDGAVYQLNDRQAIIATTDFFMPIVDDPYDFGRIAATNALSDIYAMGGRPIFALAVVGMPLDKLPHETIQAILAGGGAVCNVAGIPMAGGHSIDSAEPIYGLVAIGLVHPDRIKRNSTAHAGDAIILGKQLGIGVLSAALKKNIVSPEGYQQMLETTTQLNSVGSQLPDINNIHAMTDVTGFGLLGHLAEVCTGSTLGAKIDFNKLPLLPAAVELAQQGCTTGAAERNWKSCCNMIRLSDSLLPWQKILLCDPQTSGGLLVTCAQDSVHDVLGLFHREGYLFADKIGEMTSGGVDITVN